MWACVRGHGHVLGFTAPGSPGVCGGLAAPSPSQGEPEMTSQGCPNYRLITAANRHARGGRKKNSRYHPFFVPLPPRGGTARKKISHPYV